MVCHTLDPLRDDHLLSAGPPQTLPRSWQLRGHYTSDPSERYVSMTQPSNLQSHLTFGLHRPYGVFVSIRRILRSTATAPTARSADILKTLE